MALLAQVFNHLVLPAQLPGKQDEDPEGVGLDLLHRLIHAVETLSKLADAQRFPAWKALLGSLRRCQALYAPGRLDKGVIYDELRALEPGQPIVLHIIEQNAALIVRRSAR